MNNEPVAWILADKENEYIRSVMIVKHDIVPKDCIEIPLYTHPAKNNGGNPEELNTRQIQDARTSLESTPPFAYAVYVGEDDRQNIFLQFDHPEMCFQKYKKAIPLYIHPAKTLTEIIEKNKPEIEKVNAYIKLLEKEIQVLKAKTLTPLTDDEIEIECRKAWNLNDQYRLNLEEVIRFAHAILRKAQEK